MTPNEQNAQLISDYRACFGSPAGQRVLGDLMKFSHFRVPIDNQTGEGMRRVFLRIVNMVALSDEQLLLLYGKGQIGLKGANE